MSETNRPLPAPTRDTSPYWEAANRKQLLIQRCTTCNKAQFYPRGFCVSCLSDDLQWQVSSGRGRIYTYTICHIPGHPALADRLPYCIAMIDLAEGVRMLSEVVDAQPDQLAIGSPVEVVFERVQANLTLPKFRLLQNACKVDAEPS